MESHPNFKGDDATKGKSRRTNLTRPPRRKNEKKRYHSAPPASRGELAESIGQIEVADLPKGCPEAWIKPINDVREWALHNGLRFAMSPFEYQIAKIFGDGFTIVLWRSKAKFTKALFIKTAFEGASNSLEAHDAFDKIQALVS